MVESIWQTCTDPHQMLEIIKNKASDRKLRLFAVACCLRGKRLGDNTSLLRMVESYTDGMIGPEELWQVYNLMPNVEGRRVAVPRPLDIHEARRLSRWCASLPAPTIDTDDEGEEFTAAPELDAEALSDHCRFLRDLFGNPFRNMWLRPAWKSADVCSLARSAYDHPLPEGPLDNVRLAILGDALEEAGCTDRDTLDHCRRGGVHIRGCWLVDAILGKK